MQIRQDGLNLRAMYRTACLMSHDCTPNTKHTFRTSKRAFHNEDFIKPINLIINCYRLGDYAINLYATVDIAKGDTISATYTQTLWNTFNRREHLWTSKCFW